MLTKGRRQSTNVVDKTKASFIEKAGTVNKIRKDHNGINFMLSKKSVAADRDGYTDFTNLKQNKSSQPFVPREPLRDLKTKPGKFKFFEPTTVTAKPKKAK